MGLTPFGRRKPSRCDKSAAIPSRPGRHQRAKLSGRQDHSGLRASTTFMISPTQVGSLAFFLRVHCQTTDRRAGRGIDAADWSSQHRIVRRRRERHPSLVHDTAEQALLKSPARTFGHPWDACGAIDGRGRRHPAALARSAGRWSDWRCRDHARAPAISTA
jgi:hypothetical protein